MVTKSVWALIACTRCAMGASNDPFGDLSSLPSTPALPMSNEGACLDAGLRGRGLGGMPVSLPEPSSLQICESAGSGGHQNTVYVAVGVPFLRPRRMALNIMRVLLLFACRATGTLIDDLLDPSGTIPDPHQPLITKRPVGCYVWCHYQWDLHCFQPECGACERCKLLLKPKPPPAPPGLPSFTLLPHYFPEVNFEARDGALYLNNNYFVLKGLSWYSTNCRPDHHDGAASLISIAPWWTPGMFAYHHPQS